MSTGATRYRCPQCNAEVDIIEHGVSHLSGIGCVACDEPMEYAGYWAKDSGGEGWVFLEDGEVTERVSDA